ncbi:hypothetical protein ACFY00_26735 [Kitasatospora sp. NPDC001540]|uniref:hypothetical protein n=1 Tax=Kitasatospora sp. NPDC001540 TaxID=3364014 RepID=UPI0036C85B45
MPDDRAGLPFLQFQAEPAVPASDPEALAAELVERITSTDPRTWSRLCGGDARYAERLGHPRPEDL